LDIGATRGRATRYEGQVAVFSVANQSLLAAGPRQKQNIIPPRSHNLGIKPALCAEIISTHTI
jgi:hypothetical protein